MDRVYGGVASICEWIARLFYLNMLWILFTLMGFVVIGISPATVAMFAVTRKWISGDSDCKIFPVFWGSFKQEFWKSQTVGLTLVLISAVLYISSNVIQQDWMIGQLANVLTIIFTFLFVMTTMYMLPMFVHVHLNMKSYLRNSLLLSISHYKQTIGTMLVLLGALWLMGKFQGLVFVCSGSFIASLLTWNAHKVFAQVEHKIIHT